MYSRYSKLLFFLLSLFLLNINCSEALSKHVSKDNQLQQIIVVTALSENDNTATLQKYERQKNHRFEKWLKIGNAIPVTLGKNGLAWGLGLHQTSFLPTNEELRKKEGDGKSPMGIFALGFAFGEHASDVFSKPLKFPYRQMQSYHHCVDDRNSDYYNQIINSDATINHNYNSFEFMILKTGYYEYGITVEHNPHNLKGKGSCIFMHIKDSPTAGCNGMTKEQIQEIINWLEEKKSPILIQGTTLTVPLLIKSLDSKN